MPDDLERLSAYLDNALSSADRSALETRLADDEDLRTELERLRETVQTLRSAPELAVPRNFTLDPAKYRRAAPWWARYQRMQMLASLGTAAAVLLIAAGILLSRNTLGSPATSTGSSAVAIQPTTALSEEADKTNEQGTADKAARSAASNTPLPSATSAAGNLYALATTEMNSPDQPTTTQQAAQSGAALLPSETATETLQAMFSSAPSQPLETATAAPPMLAETSVYKSATSMATAFYAPPTDGPSAAGDAGGTGDIAPVAPQPTMPPTMVMLQATGVVGAMPATPTPAGTLEPPAANAVTPMATFAPVDNAVQPTATPTASATPTPTSLRDSQAVSGSLPMLIIIGIPLLVFCLMMLAIVWLRSRMR